MTASVPYLEAVKKRDSLKLSMHGIQPGSFEHTAWDLAIATQSLSYMAPPLAFAVWRICSARRLPSDIRTLAAVR